MKRHLLTLGLLTGLTPACTVEVTPKDIFGNVKLDVDKTTVLAYTELTMKQAALASAAITASTHRTPAAPAPQIGLAPALAACVAVSELACEADGSQCSYTEDYSACGADFAGKITRTFEGDFSTYKQTVAFAAYAEKASTDTAHFGFDGTTTMSGTVAAGSATLTQTSDGTTAKYVGTRLIHVRGSSSLTLTVLNGALTMSGTQTGTVEETGQTGSLTLTNLKFDATCADPVSGKVTTTIDDVASVVTITACGQASLALDGSDIPLGKTEVSSTFAPTTGGKTESSLADVANATDTGSLLSGTWFGTFNFDSKYREWIDLYVYNDGSGKGYFGVTTEYDDNGDDLYANVLDSKYWAYGTFTHDAANLTVSLTYAELVTYSSAGVATRYDSPKSTKVVGYELVGATKLVIQKGSKITYIKTR